MDLFLSKDENNMLESIFITEAEKCDLKPAYSFLKTCKTYSAIIDKNLLKEAHGYIMDLNEALELAQLPRFAQIIDGKTFWYSQPEIIEKSLNKLLRKEGRISPIWTLLKNFCGYIHFQMVMVD